jgi:Zn-dependent protease with chaperone function
LKEISHYLIENKNIAWSISFCCLAMLLTIFILNLILGLVVHFFDYAQPIWWHTLSPYFVCLVLFTFLWSVCAEIYILRNGGHSLAKQLKARRLALDESTPEESIVLKVVEQVAQSFKLETPAIYVLPDEVGVNALTAGFSSQDIVIILTWGALQNLDEMELYGLLSYEFNQILSGEAVENTKLKILYSGLTMFSQLGSKLAQVGYNSQASSYRNKFETFFIAIGGVIWLTGSLGTLITRAIKYLTLSSRTFHNDLKTQQLMNNDTNIQTLLRIYVHHSGSQIHSAYSESISHMCFANSLSPQSWMNIHPSIKARIFELNPTLLQDLQLENLRKLRSRPWFGIFSTLKESGDVAMVWSSPQPLPLLRLSPISFALNDAIKPLNSDIRKNKNRPELIQRAMQTATGSREVMVAILMIRQHREFIPQDAPVSHAIVDSLLNLDGRIHVQIFHDACRNIGHMPNSIARQFLTKLACIIQEDGEVGLLDALLLETVKYELNLMPAHLPTSFEDVKSQIVHLIDALLHVQQMNSPNQMDVRERFLEKFLTIEELYIYADISDEPLDLAEILNDISGLLLRDRLNILTIAERCLWSDRIITQDELDVLELLYWRFGFEPQEVVTQMQKKNSTMIN